MARGFFCCSTKILKLFKYCSVAFGRSFFKVFKKDLYLERANNLIPIYVNQYNDLWSYH